MPMPSLAEAKAAFDALPTPPLDFDVEQLSSEQLAVLEEITAVLRLRGEDADGSKLPGTDDWLSLSTIAAERLQELALSLDKETKRAISYTKKELFLSCSMNSRPCIIEEDFSYQDDPDYGSCYIFNAAPDPVDAKYLTQKTGNLQGLRVIIAAMRRSTSSRRSRWA